SVATWAPTARRFFAPNDVTIPVAVLQAPDGTVYFADNATPVSASDKRIRALDPQGHATDVAGSRGLGGGATFADLARLPDGTLLAAKTSRVWALDTAGHATVFAGSGQDFDGGLATDAPIDPKGVAVAPDGSVYIADQSARALCRVTPDGIIHLVAGTGCTG